MPHEKSSLSREQIVAAFQKISDELGQRSVKGELCLFGGSVMVLAFSVVFPPKTLMPYFNRLAIFERLQPKWVSILGFQIIG